MKQASSGEFPTILQMQQNRKYRNRMSEKEEPLQAKIELLGYFTHKLNDNHHIKMQTEDVVNDSLRQTSRQYKQSIFMPVHILVETNCIAIIDKQNKGWLVTDFLSEPICVSEMLRVRIYGIALGYNQLIVNTRAGCLLLSWGHKKAIKDSQLMQIPIRNSRHRYSHLFEIFQISDTHKLDTFSFSTLKKAADKHSLFLIPHKEPSSIIIYPEMKKIGLKYKLLGLSVGKYHMMCWDDQGQLYSWGCKSLALGHQNLPDQEYVDVPQPVYRIKGFVLKAYAGVNYSLAITLEGKLYEWGIRKTSDKGEELVFEPRQIILDRDEKLIDLKGRGQRYGALTLSGGLYLWGKKMQQHFRNPQEHLSQAESNIGRPKYYTHPNGHIVDFSISESIVGLVISAKPIVNISESQNTYWDNLKKKVGNNLKYCQGRILSDYSQQKENKSRSLLRSCKSLRKYNDPIELAWHSKLSKNNYISASSRDNEVMNFILKPQQKSIYRIRHNTERSAGHHQTKNMLKKSKWTSKRVKTDMEELMKQFQKRKENITLLQSGVFALQSKPKEKNYRATKSGNNEKQQIKFIFNKPLEKNYQQKLQLVLRKKKQLEQSNIEKNVKMLENSSFQFRMRSRIQKEELRKKSKEVECCRSSMQQTLIKMYLVKLLTKPIAEGRQLKIGNFATNLRLKRLQNNIRGVFVKNRIKIKMRHLAQNRIVRYAILFTTFRRYVRKFRQRKYVNQRKYVTQKLFKNFIKSKMKLGIAANIFNVRKLQKFREWVSMVKAERKKCLKYMWKVYLLSNMKTNPNHQISTVSNLPKNVQDLSVEVLYRQKLAMNPLLKLANFLNKYSIFKIKATYFHSLVTLFTLDSKKIKQTRIISSFQRTKRFRIKFYEQDEVQDRYNLMQNDILPFSIHYNQLIHPKNYDIMIPEIMKQNEKWIKEERKQFQKHIELILKQNSMIYRDKRRDYDADLAVFIRRNWDSLSEKRWKYIIEYNKTQKTVDKEKKQRELRRLLRLVNAESKLDEDCLPEKHLLLEQALRRHDCPQPPNSNIIFTMADFRKHFKPYFESLLSKVRQMRRSFF